MFVTLLNSVESQILQKLILTDTNKNLSFINKSALQACFAVPSNLLGLALLFYFKYTKEKNATAAHQKKLKAVLQNEILNFFAEISSNFIFLNYYHNVLNVIKKSEDEYSSYVLAIFGSIVIFSLTTYTSLIPIIIVRKIYRLLNIIYARCAKKPGRRERRNGTSASLSLPGAPVSVSLAMNHARPVLATDASFIKNGGDVFRRTGADNPQLKQELVALLTGGIDRDSRCYFLISTAMYLYLSFDENEDDNGWLNQNIMVSIISIVALLLSSLWKKME
jgi:hypothetical protein